MSDMIRKTITIPETMAAFINTRLKSGLYANDSEYFRDLVRADQRKQQEDDQREAFQAMLEKSVASGFTEDTLEEVFAEARKRVTKRKG